MSTDYDVYNQQTANIAQGTFSFTDGTNATDLNIAFRLMKINDIVYLVTAADNTSISSSVTMIESGGIPSGFRPTSTVRQPIRVQNNSTIDNGFLEIDSSGNLQIYADASGTTTFTTTIQTWGMNISWNVNL